MASFETKFEDGQMIADIKHFFLVLNIGKNAPCDKSVNSMKIGKIASIRELL